VFAGCAIAAQYPVGPREGWCTPMADPHDLQRFLDAQQDDYEQALAEIEAGRKSSHWIWYIFPQYEGLGFSPTTARYSIKTLAETRAYLEHPILGPRLARVAEALLSIEGKSASEILGSPDDLKVRSCATLFSRIAPPGSVFHRILDRYFGGEPDAKTLTLLDESQASE